MEENRGGISPDKENEEQLTGQNVFEELVNASTFKGTLRAFQQLCSALNLDPSEHKTFYSRLSQLVLTWRAKQMWTRLNARASKDVYQKGNAAINSKVLIVGGGPAGLRTAIECAFLGAKVVLVEKRDSFTRNNVLHLWDCVIKDLTSLGAKKLYKRFCISSINHISIRQLQLILLKIALLLGVEVHHSVSFESVVEPANQSERWRARLTKDGVVLGEGHPLADYSFDVLIGADGRRNSFPDFTRNFTRAKLAIAITANFINSHSTEENAVREIAGVTSYAKPDLFQAMARMDINLENIVYYKDATHYFIMTAHKSSLLERGVLLADHTETEQLLSEANIDQDQLLKFAQDAAAIATDHKLPLRFAKNHYNRPDVALFDFTSMYYSDHGARVYNRHGRMLLTAIVGDSLIEPFWPTGSGVGKGFLSSFDAAWSVRNFSQPHCNVLSLLAEHEAMYKCLYSLLYSEQLKKIGDKEAYGLDPRNRYDNLAIGPPVELVQHLYMADYPPPANGVSHSLGQSAHSTVPGDVIVRRRDELDADSLLAWVKHHLDQYYEDFVQIEDLSASWQDCRGFAALIHRFHPEHINLDKASALLPPELADLIFSKLTSIFGINPPVKPQVFSSEVPDQLTVMTILMPLYWRFHDSTPAISLPDFHTIHDVLMPSLPKTTAPAKKKEKVHDPTAPRLTLQGIKPHKKEKRKAGGKLDLSANKWIAQMNDPPKEPKSNEGTPRKKRVPHIARSAGEGSATPTTPGNIQSSQDVARDAAAEQPKAETVKCFFCSDQVYMLDRVLLEGHFFHRTCFRCANCRKVLSEHTYAYFKEEDGSAAIGTFYCSLHYRWRNEGFIGPPEAGGGGGGGGGAGGERKISGTGGKKGLAALLTSVPVDKTVKPVKPQERIVIEVSNDKTTAKSKTITEEEMSDYNYGPGYQTADNSSETLSSESELPGGGGGNIPGCGSYLDAITPDSDLFTGDWRQLYANRMFPATTASQKTANDKAANRKKRVVGSDEEDDADNEGATEVESGQDNSDDTTKEGGGGSESDTVESSDSDVGRRPSSRKTSAMQKLPVKHVTVASDDSETEREDNDAKDKVVRRRAKRKKEEVQKTVKVPVAYIRQKNQPETTAPMTFDSLFTSEDKSNPNAPKAKYEALKNRLAFLDNPNRRTGSDSNASDRDASRNRDQSSGPEEKRKSLLTEMNGVGDDDSHKPTNSQEQDSLSVKSSEGEKEHKKQETPDISKTLDYIPKSSALSMLEQLELTYKKDKETYKKPDSLDLDGKTQGKHVTILTPEKPEEKAPPVPAFKMDPRHHTAQAVRSALGEKLTVEEKRALRKKKLEELKNSHFGVNAVPDATNAIAKKPTTPVQNIPNSGLPSFPIPAAAIPQGAKSFKITNFTVKEMTKLPGKDSVQMNSTQSGTVQFRTDQKVPGITTSNSDNTIIMNRTVTSSAQKSINTISSPEVKTEVTQSVIVKSADPKSVNLKGDTNLSANKNQAEIASPSQKALPSNEPMRRPESLNVGHVRSSSTSKAFPSFKSIAPDPVSPKESGFSSDSQSSLPVKHTKLNSTVRVSLFEKKSPQPILSYTSVVSEAEENFEEPPLDHEIDPGAMSEASGLTHKQSRGSQTMQFLKKIRTGFDKSESRRSKSQEKQEKSKTLKVEPEKVENASSKSATLPVPAQETTSGSPKKKKEKAKDKDRKSQNPEDEATKKRSTFKERLSHSMSKDHKAEKEAKKKKKKEKSECKIPESKSDVAISEPLETPVESQKLERSAISQHNTPLPGRRSDEPETPVPDKPVQLPETPVPATPVKEQPPEETPEPPASLPTENDGTVEFLKKDRQARRTKNKEKIKLMQLKLGLKNLPGTLESQIDSITELCTTRRTSGVNRDLDSLYNNLAVQEKGLPYFRQTDLRRSVERLTDMRLQPVEITLDDSDERLTAAQQREKQLAQMEVVAKRMENLEHVTRCHNIELTNRALQEKEVAYEQLSARGRAVELQLTDNRKHLNKKEKAELTKQWMEIKSQLSEISAEMADKAYTRDQLLLEDKHYNLQLEIRELMRVDDRKKTNDQINREKQLLEEIIKVVAERDALVQKLETDRLEEKGSEINGSNSSLNREDSQKKSRSKIKTMFKKS